MYDRVSWRDFLQRFRWRQGDHVFVTAPTGYGKTTLVRDLLDRRSHVVVFVTKTHDETIAREFRGWPRIREWPPAVYQRKVLLWPRAGNNLRETLAEQRRVFSAALNSIAREGGWCLLFDEQYWLCQPTYCGLHLENAMLQHHGRSSGISVVNLTQRPAWVPLVTFSAASHAFVAKTTVRADLQRLSDLGGVDMKELRDNLLRLERFEYVYVPAAEGGTPVIVNRKR